MKEAPTYTPAFVAAGVAYFGSGRKGDAEAVWTEALRQRPGDRVAELYLGMLRSGGPKKS